MISEKEKRSIMLFKMLSNSTRFIIVQSLYEKELNVTRLSCITGKKISTVSKHLRLLYELDIVSFRTDDNKVFYRLKKTDIVEVIALGIRCMERR